MGVCCGAEGIRTPDALTASPKNPIPNGHGQSSRVSGSSPVPGGLLRHDPRPSQQVTSDFQSDSGQIVDTNLSDVVHVDADGANASGRSKLLDDSKPRESRSSSPITLTADTKWHHCGSFSGSATNA